ncbi:MAG TPA: PSD1 and planctomycete cytochrome C domain-containing protein, partial [Pirellulales bacterium]|nr:PSD1 and planctomycete cytochrome C domain-containing protein [Pirellulales bacterium]
MTACRAFFAVVFSLVSAVAVAAESKRPSEPVTFEKHVRSILKVRCFHCHGESGEREGELDLRLVRLMLQGGDSGPAIVPGDPSNSLLVERIRSGEMPPGDKKVPQGEIAVIERWIASGAKTARPEPAPETLVEGPLFTEEERAFWAFQPIRKPKVPKLPSKSGGRTPIDAFIVQKLAEQKLRLSAEAEPHTLVRRAYFDLLGIPPTPEEVEAYLDDPANDRFERLVDRLLARPEYGERWGRHWLDVAGYADSDGYTPIDPVRDNAYKYRDYVIQSFNRDQPLDEFIREQLAGDELIGYPKKDLSADDVQKLVATGFLRMAPDGTGTADVDQNVARNAVVADTVKIVSATLFGLTIGCAECHDHKFDPISQHDYYRLRAVFEPALDWKNWKPPRGRQASLATDADRKLSAELEAAAAAIDKRRVALQDEYIRHTFEEQLAKLPADKHEALREAFTTTEKKRTPEQTKLLKQYPSLNVSAGSLYMYDAPRKEAVAAAKAKRTALLKALGGRKDADTAKQEIAELETEIARLEQLIQTDQLKRLTDEAAATRAKKPKEDFVHALYETPGKVPATFVFHRGDFQQPKETVEPAEPAILAGGSPRSFALKSSKLPSTGRRLALAERLTDGNHPLVPRVLVNRVWLHHFGRGLVSTPSDFGMLGDRPSHPELLDWLATELIEHGWQLKRLHRLIMTSAVYRQSSGRTDELDRVDPENRLLARANVRRAEAEVIRDSILAVAGKLNPTQFGKPVPVTPDEVGQVVIGVDTRDTAGRPTGKKVDLGEAVYRRSVYIQVRRSLPLGMLETFDAPTMTS